MKVDKVVNVGWGLAVDSSICEDQYLELGSEMDSEKAVAEHQSKLLF